MAFPLKVHASYEELAAVAELDDNNRPIVPPLFAHTEPGDREWLTYHGSLLKVLLQRYKALPVTPCADLTQQYLHHEIHSCGERAFRISGDRARHPADDGDVCRARQGAGESAHVSHLFR